MDRRLYIIFIVASLVSTILACANSNLKNYGRCVGVSSPCRSHDDCCCPNHCVPIEFQNDGICQFMGKATRYGYDGMNIRDKGHGRRGRPTQRTPDYDYDRADRRYTEDDGEVYPSNRRYSEDEINPSNRRYSADEVNPSNRRYSEDEVNPSNRRYPGDEVNPPSRRIPGERVNQQNLPTKPNAPSTPKTPITINVAAPGELYTIFRILPSP